MFDHWPNYFHRSRLGFSQTQNIASETPKIMKWTHKNACPSGESCASTNQQIKKKKKNIVHEVKC